MLDSLKKTSETCLKKLKTTTSIYTLLFSLLQYRQHGDESDLHVLIFDEIDAICRSRGSRNDGTNVGDTVVNQLLTKIDGVEALNNILVIGMTNRYT